MDEAGLTEEEDYHLNLYFYIYHQQNPTIDPPVLKMFEKKLKFFNRKYFVKLVEGKEGKSRLDEAFEYFLTIFYDFLLDLFSSNNNNNNNNKLVSVEMENFLRKMFRGFIFELRSDRDLKRNEVEKKVNLFVRKWTDNKKRMCLGVLVTGKIVEGEERDRVIAMFNELGRLMHREVKDLCEEEKEGNYNEKLNRLKNELIEKDLDRVIDIIQSQEKYRFLLQIPKVNNEIVIRAMEKFVMVQKKLKEDEEDHESENESENESDEEDDDQSRKVGKKRKREKATKSDNYQPRSKKRKIDGNSNNNEGNRIILQNSMKNITPSKDKNIKPRKQLKNKRIPKKERKQTIIIPPTTDIRITSRGNRIYRNRNSINDNTKIKRPPPEPKTTSYLRIDTGRGVENPQKVTTKPLLPLYSQQVTTKPPSRIEFKFPTEAGIVRFGKPWKDNFYPIISRGEFFLLFMNPKNVEKKKMLQVVAHEKFQSNLTFDSPRFFPRFSDTGNSCYLVNRDGTIYFYILDEDWFTNRSVPRMKKFFKYVGINNFRLANDNCFRLFPKQKIFPYVIAITVKGELKVSILKKTESIDIQNGSYTIRKDVKHVVNFEVFEVDIKNARGVFEVCIMFGDGEFHRHFLRVCKKPYTIGKIKRENLPKFKTKHRAIKFEKERKGKIARVQIREFKKEKKRYFLVSYGRLLCFVDAEKNMIKHKISMKNRISYFLEHPQPKKQKIEVFVLTSKGEFRGFSVSLRNGEFGKFNSEEKMDFSSSKDRNRKYNGFMIFPRDKSRKIMVGLSNGRILYHSLSSFV